MIASAGFRKPNASPAKAEAKTTPAASPDPSFSFVRQTRIFLQNMEIRIQAPEREWHPGGDIVVFVPAENALLVGDLFYPPASLTLVMDREV